MTKLPVYEMVIDESPESDVEVSFVALVPKPAIEKNFMFFDEDEFGGPGSGPQGGDGGGGGDDDSEGDTAKILAKPRHERTESDIKHILKRKKKTEVKEIVDNGKKWLKTNPDKVATPEHRTVSREVNVGEKILKGFYSMHFAADPARQIISGPAMVADTLIYRKDAGGEYNVFFSKETIAEIALKFFKKDYQKNLNLFHDPTLSLQGVTIFESFISDKSRGIPAMKGFEDLPDGTWFISAKVENPDVWAKIQSGEVKGFSVEGIFSYTKKPKIIEDQIAEILNRTYNEDSHILKSDVMSTVKDMVAKFKKSFFDGTPLVAPVVAAPPVVASPQVLQTDYQLKDGTNITVDKLEVGGVMLISGVPAPPGDHELADGTKVTVGEGGVISGITPSMAAALPVAASITMAEVDQAIQRALTAYKEEMAAERLAATQKLTEAQKTITDQNTKINGLFDIVEELSKTPTADPVTETHLSFTKQKINDKSARLEILHKNLMDLRKSG